MKKSILSLAHLTLSMLLALTSPLSWALNFQGTVTGKDLFTKNKIEVPPGKRGTIVIFMSAKCPCSNSHVGIVKKLADTYSDYAFVAVHSNADEPAAAAAAYFKTVDFKFPVILDDDRRLADQLKALKTPHAYIISNNGDMLYQGGVTDSSDGPRAKQNYLLDALRDLEAGRKVAVTEGRTLGCAISRGTKHVW